FTCVAVGAGDSDLAPLYPAFLAGVYATLGRDTIAVALVQMGLDAVTVALIFAIGRRVAGTLTGLIAAACYGLYPYLVFQNLTINDTVVFIFLLALGVALAYRTRASRRRTDAAARGV